MTLTDRQGAVLDFIRHHVAEIGYPPTTREICVRFGMKSPTGAVAHLTALAKKGAIRWDRHVSRGIVVLGSDPRDERIRELESEVASLRAALGERG
jgi:repressor LexA